MVSPSPACLRRPVLLLLGLGLALPAAARIVCCDVDGKRVCGDPPPSQCTARAQTVFSKGGTAKSVEAPLTAEQRAARAAEAARKKEEEKQAAEQARKDRALLDGYSSERDIDAARDRAVANIEKNASQAQARLEAAQKRQKQLEQEREFYQKKPAPAQLRQDIENNARELAVQEKTLAQRDVDIAAARERYEADKQRYLLLTGKAAAKK